MALSIKSKDLNTEGQSVASIHLKMEDVYTNGLCVKAGDEIDFKRFPFNF